ncbi:hypothetical protein [Kiritimatiella glycovorans]|uniref:Uncharacterized protein n=1 Tax=Kiritimatiella glycovorans TaxID=1307763 RepID=A0A0G3EH73_9BACT|nr:hypothetical protein [Kiritimatiella glycovorans]AKJ64165.1 hypothetical protein L21SP4_00902 [Kiritimatiella glycovorans]
MDNSRNVFLSGFGATPWTGFLEDESLFVVERSRDVTLCNLIEDWLPGKPENKQPAIRAVLNDGTTFQSGPNTRAVLFKITSEE